MSWWVWVIIILFVIGAISNSVEEQNNQKMKNDMRKKQKEAENYIMNSGDSEAIKMLMLARANPANYSQILAGGMNKGNPTLKTALGVMTGLVVGNIIIDSISTSAIQNALQNIGPNLNTVADFDVSDAGDFDGFFDDIDF